MWEEPCESRDIEEQRNIITAEHRGIDVFHQYYSIVVFNNTDPSETRKIF